MRTSRVPSDTGSLGYAVPDDGRTPADDKGGMGLTLGSALVIAGIVIAIFWSLILGVIVALIGLVAFGGFARGRWY